MKFLEDFKQVFLLFVVILLILLLGTLVSIVRAELICVPVGQYVTCFHQGGHQTIQTPLGPNYGAIIGPQGTTPYAICRLRRPRR